MTIFDYITDIQTTKLCNLPTEEYNAYMANRWLSFYSDKITNSINESVNIFGVALDKQQHYKMLSVIVPKTRYAKHLKYIKKASKVKKENDIDALAYNMQLSQREINEMLEFREKIIK